ncbi:speE, partial [Symbiodinium pilosum]
EHIRESAEWLSAEALCQAHLLSGDYVAAAEAAIKGILQALTGSVAIAVPHVGVKQKELEKWKSKYQVGEVWLNMCGDKLCRELVLGDVRQISDVFERYYHEAMVYPGLNLLGANKKRRVLILGGGDGGVATAALRFDTVEQVVNVDIDSFVTRAATKWFPKVAAGLNDSRCEMLHLDAFAWVEEQQEKGMASFDLVVIDFTDEPIKGAWSKKFFLQLKGLLSTDGIVVQNVGTILNPQDMRKVFTAHAEVFATVFPMHATIPDYLGPYILVLSSVKELDTADVDWTSWERQHIAGQYYGGAAQHHALFRAVPADVSRLLGLPLDLDQKGSPQAPSAVALPLPAFKNIKSGDEKVIFRTKGLDGSKVKVAADKESMSLYQDRDLILDSKSLERDEILLLPALVMLGDRCKSVLVLGGGTGSIAALALHWPTVERIVVVEADMIIVEVVRKHFPKQAEVLSDPRVELIIADVFAWLTQDAHSKFDLVVVNMLDQPWLPSRRTTRLPRTKAFHRLLRAKVAVGGLLTQEAGSVGMLQEFGAMLAIHRQVFTRSWPMAMSSSSPQPTVPGDEFDGLYFRLPRLLLLSSPDAFTPMQATWVGWQGFLQSLGSTTYYHPRMHDSLFVLPAELQRRFDLPATAASEEIETAASRHLVHTFMLEASGCSDGLLNDLQAAGTLLSRLAALGDLTELGHLDHKFQPQGLTALLLVSESHLSIHTWPELGYAVVDVVSCKPIRPTVRKAMEIEVQRRLGCGLVLSKFLLRGRELEVPGLPSQTEDHAERPLPKHVHAEEL